MYKLVLTGWCFLFCFLANGQVLNIDKIDTLPYNKKVHWEGKITTSFEVYKQKNTLYNAGNMVDALVQQQKHLGIFSFANRYTYSGAQTNLNTGHVHIRYRWAYNAVVHPETYVQFQWDAQNGLKERFVGGMNLRYKLLHSTHSEISLASGVMYERERWNYTAVEDDLKPADLQDVHTSVLKSNNYLKWEGNVAESSTVKLAVFYQSLFVDFFKPRVSALFALQVRATKHLSIGIHYHGLYDSKPIVPINNFYYNFSNNIIYHL